MLNVMFGIIAILSINSICFYANIQNYDAPCIESVIEYVEQSRDKDQALANWMGYNITYREDVYLSQEWAGADETIRSGEGDCEDFSQVAFKVLDYFGKNPFIVGIYYDKKKDVMNGHAVCAYYNEDGYYVVISQGKVYLGGDNIHDLGLIIAEQTQIKEKVKYMKLYDGNGKEFMKINMEDR